MTAGEHGWKDERNVELVKKLWADGLSASQVAVEIYRTTGTHFTRSGIIGKVHRLGLSGRASAAPPGVKAAAIAKAARKANPPLNHPPRVPQPPRLPPAGVVVPFAADADALQPLPEEERCAHWCRWPIGDPLSDGFGFCGREQGWLTELRRDPYCPHHRSAERARNRARPTAKPQTEQQLVRALRRYL